MINARRRRRLNRGQIKVKGQMMARKLKEEEEMEKAKKEI